jgi:hypothetical protein
MLTNKAQALMAETLEHRAEVLEWIRQHPQEFEVAVLMFHGLELCHLAITELWAACGSEMALKYLIEADPDQKALH